MNHTAAGIKDQGMTTDINKDPLLIRLREERRDHELSSNYEPDYYPTITREEGDHIAETLIPAIGAEEMSRLVGYHHVLNMGKWTAREEDM